MNAARHTVAVLYPGELGARVGAALRTRGVRVITTLQGRGAASQRRCAQSGIEVRPTLADVAGEADVVLSLVPPAAAEELAGAYAQFAHRAPAGAIYADCNSIGPELASALADRIEAAGRSFVDGAVNGLAKNFTAGGTLFLSGPRAAEVATLFDGVTRVQIVGPEAGAASAMKMLLSGLSKGMCALFLELALSAQRREMLGPMLAASSEIYPEITQLVRRMLPTYARHAGRRATEMQQLEQTVNTSGIGAGVVGAVRELHERLAQVGWSSAAPAASEDVVALLEHLAQSDFGTAAARAPAPDVMSKV